MIILSRSGTLVRTRPTFRGWARIAAKALSALGALLLGITALFPTPSIHARTAANGEPFRYFVETGHNLSGPAQTFYDRHGGAAIFGLPITEVIQAGDYQVQYFERARFELRQNTILLSLIGRIVTEARTDPAFAWLNESPVLDCIYYPQSGHTLGGAFGVFWQSQGGLSIFGYPISEEFIENDTLVQYFERARFEYHPEHTGSEVQLSQLGREYAQRMGVPEELLAPAPPIVKLGTAAIAIPTSAQHSVALATQRIDGVVVAPGMVLSFLHTIGEVSARAGYKQGQAIVNGEVRSNIGGGICYVSTALYRAAFLAGQPIVERHPHTIALASLSDIPGFDSAVDTTGPDLRWSNDTPTPIIVTAKLTNGRLVVALWGQGDSRTTTLRGPIVKKGPGVQIATIGRVVLAANGHVIRNETVQSRYVLVPITTAAYMTQTPPTRRARVDL